MPCITHEMYEDLQRSEEVLIVELDNLVSPAQTESENGELIPWGADLVLQSSWDELPEVVSSDPKMSICIVDSGLLLEHQDIVSLLECVKDCMYVVGWWVDGWIDLTVSFSHHTYFICSNVV